MSNKSLLLKAISPLDGRYNTVVSPLNEYFSEYALYKYRVFAEVKYLIYFLRTVRKQKISEDTVKKLNKFLSEFSVAEADKIKQIEEKIRHDVKAVEYYLQPIMKKIGLGDTEFLHFGLTSEDINSIAYGLAIKTALQAIIIPELSALISDLTNIARTYKGVPMPARTHGQVAVPTTFGKEIIVFAARLAKETEHLARLQPEAKLTGAVGNYNALLAAYPETDWIRFGDEFIRSLGLTSNHITTQIIPADSYIKIFQSLELINSVLIGLDQDMWRYISDGYVKQKVTKHEVGSSTMPQKVNPIDFENSEGNLGIANALLAHFSLKLPISRLQRDLSDSTVKRNIGSAFAYSFLGYHSCRRGLFKIEINKAVLEKELSDHWETVTEGIQTLLRLEKNGKAYETVKDFSRGKEICQKDIEEFIESLDVDAVAQKKFKKLTPQSYTGLAEKIVDDFLRREK